MVGPVKYTISVITDNPSDAPALLFRQMMIGRVTTSIPTSKDIYAFKILMQMDALSMVDDGLVEIEEHPITKEQLLKWSKQGQQAMKKDLS